MAMSTGTDAPYTSPVRGSLSAPTKWMCFTAGSSGSRPAASSTSLSRAPPHTAVPMAPWSQASPLTGFSCDISVRRLPEHCTVAASVYFLKSRCSASTSSSRRLMPSPSTTTRHAPGFSGAGGTGRWLRTKNRSVGVTRLPASRWPGVSALHGLSDRAMRAGWRGGSCVQGSPVGAAYAALPGPPTSWPMRYSLSMSCTSGLPCCW
mmetsp:Transcript_1267/g.3525  ORF Transcript_1267/g.3525 Transcript_1267/m.3525 type:complete len:206 (+) Transcript_1267:814-1431(+)